MGRLQRPVCCCDADRGRYRRSDKSDLSSYVPAFVHGPIWGFAPLALVIGATTILVVHELFFRQHKAQTDARAVAEPARSVDFGLRCIGLNFGKDEFTQVRFILKNSLNIPLEYVVEKTTCTLDNLIEDNAGAPSKWILGANSETWYASPRFAINTEQRTAKGTARIVYKFGEAGATFSRRVTYAATFSLSPKGNLFTTFEDVEVSI